MFKVNLLWRDDRKQRIIAGDLATEAHTTASVISIFFLKIVIRYAFGCFQNLALYGFGHYFKLY